MLALVSTSKTTCRASLGEVGSAISFDKKWPRKAGGEQQQREAAQQQQPEMFELAAARDLAAASVAETSAN